MKEQHIQPPSPELQRRMKALRQMPRPPLDKVMRQAKASALFRAEFDAKQSSSASLSEQKPVQE